MTVPDDVGQAWCDSGVSPDSDDSNQPNRCKGRGGTMIDISLTLYPKVEI